MAVSPTEKRYAQVSLQVNNSLGTGSRTVTATLPGGVYPGANLPVGTSSVSVTISESAAGVSPPSGGLWGIAVVRDNSDVSPNYTVTGNVLSYTAIGGTGGSLATTANITVPEHGMFRIVLVTGDTAERAQNGTGLDTGGTSPQYHRNSDAVANGSRGAFAIVGNTVAAIAGYSWRNTVVASRSYSIAGNLRYGHTTTISVGLAVGTYINPKAIKVALKTTGTDGTPQDGVYRPTPNTSGNATTVTINVDTDFVSTPTGYFLHIGTNTILGDSTTPAGEIPDFLGSGTITGTTTSQRAWITFDTSGHLAGFTGTLNRVISDSTDKTISSGITIYRDAGITPGAQTFADAGYSITQNIFKRQGGGNTFDAIPYIETYVYDGYGNPLNSVNVRAETQRQTDSGVDNGQNLATDANGRIRWNYTISTTAAAFNRYVKPAATRSTGSYVADGPDSAGSPPSTFSIGNSDWPAEYSGPKPCYPRRIWIRGNAFAGTKEPNNQADYVFGINSELVAESMWTGTLAAIATETVQFVDVVTGISDTTTLTSGVVTTNSNHFYLAVVSRRETTADIIAMTGLGLTWTNVTSSVGGDGRVGIWRGEGIASGNGTVQVTFSTNPINSVIAVSRYSGVLLTSPVESFDVSNDTTSVYGGSIIGTDKGMTVIAMTFNNKTHNPPGEGAVERHETVSGTGTNTSTLVTTTNGITLDGSQSYSGSLSNTSDWSLAICTLRPNVTPLDSNGVPLGNGTREQPLGGGSLKAKLTSFVDEGTILVIDPTRYNIKDIAGRNVIMTAGAKIYLKRAEWNLTSNSLTSAGTALNDNATALESPLTYKDGNLSLDSISAPTDPSSLAYYQGYADTTGQRNTFILAVDQTNVGFTGDTGMFGYFRLPISFFAVDLAITCVVTPEVVQSAPTIVRRFGIKTLRVTTSDEYVSVAPDEPPSYAIFGLQNDGQQVQLASGYALPTNSLSDFYVDLTIPTGYFAVKLLAFAKVNGSRTPGGDSTPIQIGFEFDAVDFATGFPFR